MAKGWPSNLTRMPCFRSSPLCGSNSKEPKRYKPDFAGFEANRNLIFLPEYSHVKDFIQRHAFHFSWALDRIPGGSSGGSAAATATGLCFGALGTDTAASVRGPASFCGVVGFKPTYGRVSNRGVVPLSWTMDHVGPLCRTVEDAALMLSVIAGYDEMDPASVDKPVPDYTRDFRMQTSKLRLGIPKGPFFDNLDPEIARAVDTAITIVRKLMASSREIELPSSTLPMDQIYASVRAVEAYTYHACSREENVQRLLLTAARFDEF